MPALNLDLGAIVIRHIVLVRFSSQVEDALIQSLFDELHSLRQVMEGIETITHGKNVSSEGMAHGFTHSFVVDFTDSAVRDAYLIHPAHRALSNRLVEVAGDLGAFLVFDQAV